ncbi:unnamed protein product, partial [Rotaria sordida]
MKTKKTQASSYLSTNDNFYGSSNVTAKAHHGATASSYTQPYADPSDDMMHNRMNTDIDILIRNCKKKNLASARNNCVLLTTGSFNPVHPLHFQNLMRVKQYLERELETPWNVLAGYLSPTHDSYVHEKLGDRDWIPAKDRCRLCEAAIQYEGEELSSWVRVSR